MGFVKWVTVALSLIALLTGAMDVIIGVAGQANIGVGTPATAPYDPVLDSQIRFLGAVWFGLGAIQLICLRDVRRYAAILQTCFAIIVLGGLGRILSIYLVGIPGGGIGAAFIIVALIIELVLIPAAWFALRSVLAYEGEWQSR